MTRTRQPDLALPEPPVVGPDPWPLADRSDRDSQIPPWPKSARSYERTIPTPARHPCAREHATGFGPNFLERRGAARSETTRFTDFPATFDPDVGPARVSANESPPERGVETCLGPSWSPRVPRLLRICGVPYRPNFRCQLIFSNSLTHKAISPSICRQTSCKTIAAGTLACSGEHANVSAEMHST